VELQIYILKLQKAIGATENLMEILDETPEDISDVQLTSFEKSKWKRIF